MRNMDSSLFRSDPLQETGRRSQEEKDVVGFT